MRPERIAGDAGTAASETRMLFARKPKIASPCGVVDAEAGVIRPKPPVTPMPLPCVADEYPPRAATEYGTALTSEIFAINASSGAERVINGDAVGKSADEV